MKKINKKAFTLAEALVVMFIIGIVALAALHNMTKKAPLRPDEAQHGQYACWYDSSKTYNPYCEQYVIGRRTDSERCLPKCTFTPDRKIASYAIYIVGAGVQKTNDSIQGQFVSGSFGGADFKEDVDIILGGSNVDNARVQSQPKGTSFGTRKDLFARNGQIVQNGLVMDNVKSCRVEAIAPTNGRCVTEFTGDSNIVVNTGTPRGCSIAESGIRIGQEGKTIRLDGCKALVDRVPIPDTEINTGVPGTMMKATVIEAMLETRALRFTGDKEKRVYKYEGKIHDESGFSDGATYTINVQLWDSDYTIQPDPQNPVSKMSVLLDPAVLPKFRRSEITDKLHDLKPGVGLNSRGAVFIMW